MRVMDIAIFMFVFQVIGGIIIGGGYLQQMGFYPNVLTMHNDVNNTIQNASNQLYNTTNTITQGVTQSSDPLASAFGLFYQWMMSSMMSLINAVNPIIWYVAWLPLVMQWAGIPAELAWGFFLIYTGLEVIAFLQMISGRSFKEYD
jgi:hypothetical protein